MIYIVMGVSGCGKSTVGKLLANQLVLPFFDADDFHPKSNLTKMAEGTPLNDDDRKPWLILLADLISDWECNGGAVLACSALKKSYRDLLRSTTVNVVKFIYLKGDQQLLSERIGSREGHFMPYSLLQSQLDTLEPPENEITVEIDDSVDVLVGNIIKEINRVHPHTL